MKLCNVLVKNEKFALSEEKENYLKFLQNVNLLTSMTSKICNEFLLSRMIKDVRMK